MYFITIVDKNDNELIILELIHSFVEVLDKYFGNVCELDLIFNFHKVSTTIYIRPTSLLTNSLLQVMFLNPIVNQSSKTLNTKKAYLTKESQKKNAKDDFCALLKNI